MGSIIGHRIDYNGVGGLRGQRYIRPATIFPGSHFGSQAAFVVETVETGDKNYRDMTVDNIL